MLTRDRWTVWAIKLNISGKFYQGWVFNFLLSKVLFLQKLCHSGSLNRKERGLRRPVIESAIALFFVVGPI